MPQTVQSQLVTPATPTPGQAPDPKTLKILAKSIFKEIKGQGYDNKQVVSLATELISLVTDELQNQ